MSGGQDDADPVAERRADIAARTRAVEREDRDERWRALEAISARNRPRIAALRAECSRNRRRPRPPPRLPRAGAPALGQRGMAPGLPLVRRQRLGIMAPGHETMGILPIFRLIVPDLSA